ncbi:hypothetical protein ERO13_D06G050300v2 [Gossypium hirsutum]|uniref:Uncharacterized protein n=3 Tax=Gossypium TaxID=3633 RepID=A0A0D2U6Z9_GOSRA|nr:hypothetical protein ES319_D06G057400v1 [Gossypium barbadense]KAG4140981.1 hypothetical protein ERO13_D06G050300v2 [Gossypium hirsutum]KJB64614.1 hypothetical protein B456_010G057200 [Gossypium raimondii]TYI76183.1 hypothetical protein E1A91_D06G058600v1 [Gossypium mustelinum]
MRPSRLAVSLLVLFIIYLSSVQGIRLEKSFKSAGHDPIQEGALMKNSNGAMGDILLCKQGHCTGTKKRKSHHWLPSIHEDYYGPRKHRPRHH